MSDILKVNGLNKKYKDFSLKDINITIPKGVIVGFIGENGAGKTTTIKAILNLINIDSGEIKIFDKDYKRDEKFIKEKIGVLLDDSFFSERLTVLDINVILKNIYKNYDEVTFFNYLDKLKLPRDKKLSEFSTGMLMKLKIITALSHHPELLILDEPTSGLDPVARADILDIFKDFIQDENHSIFVSSHITSDLEHIADYIIFIKDGGIILIDEKDKLIDNYGVVKCSEKEFNLIKKTDYIKYRKNKYDYELLVKNKTDFKKKYNIKTVDKASLEDIMLFYIRGE